MKTLGQIAYEVGMQPPAPFWGSLCAETRERWETIAKAVAAEAVRRMADTVVEEAKVFRSGSHN